LTQLVINFAFPLLILTKLSGPNQLGATGALMAALAIPITYELVNIVKRRKIQMISLIAIGGILVTGIIGLLGLSENWLAVRRSAVYFAGAIGIGFCAAKGISVTEFLLKQAVDWQTIQKSSKQTGNSQALKRYLLRSDIALVLIAALMSAVSFVLTKAIIDAPTGSAEFNQQYAELRVISLAAITGPLIVGLVCIVTFLLIKIEKLTGLSSDQLTSKKR
jgi:MFS family permease